MAYLKIFPIKVTDKKALDYITNPDKTDEKLLVSSFGCSPETADLEFSMTREMAKKNGMDKGDNLAFHLIQSFKPGEVDAETAHRLGQQFADEVLKGKYEYVISTHVDKTTFITTSSLMQQVLLIITNIFPISGATIKSAGSVIVSAMKMDLPPVCQPEKKVKAIKRTWNTIVAPVGKPSYVLQLIKQSGLPSTMRNFYKKCS